MKITYQQNGFYRFAESPALFESSGPQGFIGEFIIPTEGDLIQNPHDIMSHKVVWVELVNNALPESLTLGEPGGWDNDIYKVEKKQ